MQFDEFMVHKCPDIAGVMLFEPDKDKQTEYIKNSYRHKEFTEFYVGEERAGYRADENGLTVWKGELFKPDSGGICIMGRCEGQHRLLHGKGRIS